MKSNSVLFTKEKSITKYNGSNNGLVANGSAEPIVIEKGQKIELNPSTGKINVNGSEIEGRVLDITGAEGAFDFDLRLELPPVI